MTTKGVRQRIIRAVFTLGALSLLTGALIFILRFELFRLNASLPAYTHGPGPVEVHRLAMRDGVKLYTKIYHTTEEPAPVVLVRNPYNIGDYFGFFCGVFVRYGYTCVHQDVRGRLRSEGVWSPLENERKDGLDTLAWLTEQTWQNKKIAMYGMSYLGAVQWAIADAVPQEVKTLIPVVSGTDSFKVMYQGGMFRHEIFTAWAALMPDSEMHFEHGSEYQAALKHRPHQDADQRFFGKKLPWYRDWIGNPTRGSAYWQRTDVRMLATMPERARVPMLLIGGWYDLFLEAQLDDFHRLATRSQSAMLIGPWHHLARDADDRSYPGAKGAHHMWFSVLDWLGHHLKNRPMQLQPGTIRTYAIGASKWQTRPSFPPPTEPRWFHLSGAQAQRCEQGKLKAATSSVSAPALKASFVYDPSNPVPSRGGAGLLAFALPTYEGVSPGSFDQRGLCERADVLSFQSPPLAAPVHIAGSIRVHLSVSSTAEDTAFTVKLMEVKPDGRALNIRDTIRSLRHRNGDLHAEDYSPGEQVQLRLKTWPIEWQLSAGSRLRVDISSSNFPAYHVHPNLPGPWAEQGRVQRATQRVQRGSVELPVVRPELSPPSRSWRPR